MFGVPDVIIIGFPLVSVRVSDAKAIRFLRLFRVSGAKAIGFFRFSVSPGLEEKRGGGRAGEAGVL